MRRARPARGRSRSAAHRPTAGADARRRLRCWIPPRPRAACRHPGRPGPSAHGSCRGGPAGFRRSAHALQPAPAHNRRGKPQGISAPPRKTTTRTALAAGCGDLTRLSLLSRHLVNDQVTAAVAALLNNGASRACHTIHEPPSRQDDAGPREAGIKPGPQGHRNSGELSRSAANVTPTCGRCATAEAERHGRWPVAHPHIRHAGPSAACG